METFGNGMDCTISKHDNMFGTAGEEAYFSAAASAIECIDYALKMSNVERINSILDFPCGYGRILRALASRFPKAELTACDIVKEGVDFCSSQFGSVGYSLAQKI